MVKLGYNDHGPIHAQVVAAASMQMMQLLHQRHVRFDVSERLIRDQLIRDQATSIPD